ncbi:MAG TPA: NAD-binding protein, partial [Pseudoxanthomonas sp.]|nr:NAD-binding protein [Pseudoxanthomonas sp.]
DGTRLDVLHASGAGRARAVAVCVDDREAASRIAALVRESFPLARVLVRAYDREHARQLVEAGADYQVRETFAAAVEFGVAALRAVGVPEDEAVAIAEDVRRLDAERFAMEVAAGSLEGGRQMLRTNVPKPTPLRPPQREGRTLNEDGSAADADGAGA